jgi:hypothetical protein
VDHKEVLLASKKPVLFQFATTSMHFAASLEICSHLNKEASINYFFWGASTLLPNSMNSNPGMWPRRIPDKYKACIKESNANVTFSTKLAFDTAWVQERLDFIFPKVSEINSMEDLRKLDSKDLKPSSAISNCLTTLLSQNSLSFKKHGGLIKRVLSSYLQVYSAVQTASALENYDLGLIFNGRFLHERACWDALQNLGIKTLLFETTRDRYFLRPEGFHSRTTNQDYINKFWENSKETLAERERIAEENYRARRYGKNKYILMDEEKRTESHEYFAFFANSDDEAFGFWESWLQPLGSQIDVIKKLQDLFDARQKELLLIRLHPNFANKSKEEQRKWSSIIPSAFSRVIGYSEEVSSYDVMANAKGVLTFGSTIGLESAFWNKPVAVLADCHYDELGVADKLANWDEVNRWLEEGYRLDSTLINQRHMAACKKPWFLHLAGEDFVHTSLKEIGNPGWGAWEATSFKGIGLKTNFLIKKFSRAILRLKLFKVKSPLWH